METLLKLKSYIDPHTLIVGDFKTPLSPINRSLRQKLNRELLEIIDTNQRDLIHYLQNIHAKTKEYICFSAPHRTFPKTDDIVSDKASLTIYKNSK